MSRVVRRLAAIALTLGLAHPATAQTTVRYVHTDALGSVVAMTDENRVVVERREYEPYGQQLTALDDGPGYTGHVQDAATGLTYMQQRYFDPQLGQFLSVDPVTAIAGSGDLFNRYRYANGNPFGMVDPDGRAPIANTCSRAGGQSCSGGYSLNLSSQPAKKGGGAKPQSTAGANTDRPDSRATAEIGRKSSSEANVALRKAGVAGKLFPSRGAAARAWANVVHPIANKYNTEIASRMFLAARSQILLGSATSDGFIYSVNPDFSEGPGSMGITAGFVHTHPTNSMFSQNDMNYAIEMYRIVNGSSHNTANIIEQSAFVSLPGGRVVGWNASSFFETGGASNLNSDYYSEH